MSKVYRVTAHDLKSDFQVNEFVFSSKLKAEKTAEDYKKYLISNHDLNKENTEEHIKSGIFHPKKTIWYLDNKYTVTLSEHIIEKKVIKFD